MLVCTDKSPCRGLPHESRQRELLQEKRFPGQRWGCVPAKCGKCQVVTVTCAVVATGRHVRGVLGALAGGIPTDFARWGCLSLVHQQANRWSRISAFASVTRVKARTAAMYPPPPTVLPSRLGRRLSIKPQRKLSVSATAEEQLRPCLLGGTAGDNE